MSQTNKLYHALIMLLLQNSASCLNPGIRLAASLSKNTFLPCILWTRGNLTASESANVHEEFDRDLINDSLESISQHTCLPCLTLIGRFEHISFGQFLTHQERNLNMKKLNRCVKFPFSTFQVILVHGTQDVEPFFNKTFLYTTHIVVTTGFDTIVVCTMCANNRPSSCSKWKVGESVKDFHKKCAHPLAAKRQRALVMDTLPFVNVAGEVYGMNIDLLKTIADAVGFSITFDKHSSANREVRYAKIGQRVNLYWDVKKTSFVPTNSIVIYDIRNDALNSYYIL